MSIFPATEIKLKEFISDIERSKRQRKQECIYMIKHYEDSRANDIQPPHIPIMDDYDEKYNFIKLQVEKELSLLEKIGNEIEIDFRGTPEEFLYSLQGKKLYIMDPEELKTLLDKAKKYDKMCEIINAYQ